MVICGVVPLGSFTLFYSGGSGGGGLWSEGYKDKCWRWKKLSIRILNKYFLVTFFLNYVVDMVPSAKKSSPASVMFFPTVIFLTRGWTNQLQLLLKLLLTYHLYKPTQEILNYPYKIVWFGYLNWQQSYNIFGILTISLFWSPVSYHLTAFKSIRYDFTCTLLKAFMSTDQHGTYINQKHFEHITEHITEI